MLRCKFCVSSIATEEDRRTLVLQATNQKDGDNQDWSQWTPSGELKIVVTNKAAFEKIDAMKRGDYYWLDLSPIEKQS